MKKIILILLIFTLSACSEMNSKFNCPMKSGIRCESIDSIDKHVDRGEIGHESMGMLSDKHLQQMPIYQKSNISSLKCYKKNEPLRYGETVQRLWIAPFEDRQGNYHQESDIYTITKPGHWIGAPLKEINEDGE